MSDEVLYVSADDSAILKDLLFRLTALEIKLDMLIRQTGEATVPFDGKKTQVLNNTRLYPSYPPAGPTVYNFPKGGEKNKR